MKALRNQLFAALCSPIILKMVSFALLPAVIRLEQCVLLGALSRRGLVKRNPHLGRELAGTEIADGQRQLTS